MTAWVVDDEHADDFRAGPPDVVDPARVVKSNRGMILEKDMAGKQVKVKVSDRWSVVHDGTRYVKGDTVTVPESLADEWLRNHWVEQVHSKAK